MKNFNKTVPGKTTIKADYICDKELNCALINCRSLKPKMQSLIETFNMNSLTIALLNETWLYKSDKPVKKIITDMKNEHGYDLIRRDRNSRGGGVAVAFDSRKISLKKLQLSSLRNCQYEILATRGKLRSYKKEITVFSCYLPPKLNKNESQNMIECLADAIGEAKSTSDGWFLIGGDWNGRALGLLLQLYPDLAVVQTPPTRKNRTLDILLSNFGKFVVNTSTCFLIEGEEGQTSDHKIVIAEAMLPRPKTFQWEIHEYMKITDKGTERFKKFLDAEDWTVLQSLWPDQDKMAEAFQAKLHGYMLACFSWKRVRRKTSDKPWISDAIRVRIKRRKAVFRIQGRSDVWKRLNKGIQKTIAFRKRIYEKKITEKLENAGKTGQWFSIYKYLSSDEMPERWNVSEICPDDLPAVLADKLAEHFSQITNLASPLDLDHDIPQSSVGPGLIPQLTVKNVEKVLRHFKKSNSRVTGDIPKELVNQNTLKLAQALTPIYNASFLNKSWPAVWKVETVIPIPKTISPGDFDDIRPISMTTLWSKVMETYVATFTIEETALNWNKDQYGGRKGSSTDHVLISLWNDILSGLDAARGDSKSKAVVLTGIDFSKSFSRCSFQEILKA